MTILVDLGKIIGLTIEKLLSIILVSRLEGMKERDRQEQGFAAILCPKPSEDLIRGEKKNRSLRVHY